MCANCFRAEISEKEVTAPIGRSDTEAVSLLPQPNSPHSPLGVMRSYSTVIIQTTVAMSRHTIVNKHAGNAMAYELLLLRV